MDKKFWFQLFLLVIVILGGTFFVFNSKYLIPFASWFSSERKQNPSNADMVKNLKITDSENNIKAELRIEVADTDAKRSRGLGFRTSLATDSGMLFEHSQIKKYTYWMKGMEFPIDFIWILDNKIVDIISEVPPPIKGQTDDTLERYSPTVSVNRVLETNAGFTAKNNIQIGDQIILEP